jgi:hypothetical protein
MNSIFLSSIKRLLFVREKQIDLCETEIEFMVSMWMNFML